MSSHLRHCPKHRKPLPCPHCKLAAKSAQTPPVTVVQPHKADARPALRSAITPEIREQIEDSLAPAPQIEKTILTEQIESSRGLKTVSVQEDRVPDVDSIAENTDKTRTKKIRVLTPPKRAAKQPVYLTSVAHPVVMTSEQIGRAHV